MAMSLMTGKEVDNDCMYRPFHKASKSNKIICPKSKCVKKLLILEKNGLRQHYRVIHKHNADLVKASSMMCY